MHGPAALLLALPRTLTGFTFESATPASQGMSAAGLDALRVFSNQIYPDNGILVMRFDKVVLEAYSGGTTVTRQRAIYSATKSDGLLTLSDLACGEDGRIEGVAVLEREILAAPKRTSEPRVSVVWNRAMRADPGAAGFSFV